MMSQSWSFSEGSIYWRIDTFEKNYFNLSLVVLAELEVTCLNVDLSNSNKTPDEEHLIDAALGAEYNKASSPKTSPAL